MMINVVVRGHTHVNYIMAGGSSQCLHGHWTGTELTSECKVAKLSWRFFCVITVQLGCSCTVGALVQCQ
jgi:hypothetical protein